VNIDTTRRDSLGLPIVDTATAAVSDTTAERGFYVSFAAFLTQDRATELAAKIHVGGETAKIVTSTRDGSTIYRVVLGPYLTKDEAEKAGKDSGQSYWVYEGLP
jgi:cell division protein FtsN